MTMFKTKALAAALAVTVLPAISTSAQTYQPVMTQPALTQPAMYVVMFRADWCAPCKVVEPNLIQARDMLRDPSVEYLTFDITDPARSEISAHHAFDRELVPQYNSWMGVTGFAAIIDGDTKRTLGCVNMLYDAASTAKHISNLKTYAVSNQPSTDFTCPEPNAPR
jgi:thiol-disulfide isomerase/thioredoxin